MKKRAHCALDVTMKFMNFEMKYMYIVLLMRKVKCIYMTYACRSNIHTDICIKLGFKKVTANPRTNTLCLIR